MAESAAFLTEQLNQTLRELQDRASQQLEIAAAARFVDEGRMKKFQADLVADADKTVLAAGRVVGTIAMFGGIVRVAHMNQSGRMSGLAFDPNEGGYQVLVSWQENQPFSVVPLGPDVHLFSADIEPLYSSDDQSSSPDS